MRWRKVTLIGVGLLGGSLGMGLRRRGLAGEVHGYVRRESSIAECVRAGAVDSASTDLGTAVAGADLLVFCTPLAQMEELAASAARHVSNGALVTDVGSVKAPLVRRLEPIFAAREAVFVGSHPMAGSEKMGVAAAQPDLFLEAACVVTPTSSSPPDKVREVEDLWRAVGGRVLRMAPEKHDELVALSSHLPHVLAAQLAIFVLGSAEPEVAKLCASGFKDSTRIASGSPEMWRDIAVMNREHVRTAIKEFCSRLNQFQEFLEKGDPVSIEEFFQRAKSKHDAWAARCASPSPE